MIYLFEDCELDTATYTLSRLGQQTRLRPKVFQVLLVLLTSRDRVVSKQELSEAVWPDQFISDETLESTISRVRRALGDNGREQRVIRTLSGHGYRFVAPVTERGPADTDLESQEPETAVATPPPGQPLPPRGEPAPVTAPAPERRPVRQRRPSVPFVGRDMQFGVCKYVLDDARAGRPSVILIQGEAGIGKTSLIKQIQDAAGQREMQLCMGRSSETFSVPYAPFVRALRMPWMQMGDVLEGVLGPDAAVISEWLGPDPASASEVSAEQADQDKLRLALAVSRTLMALAQHHPVLFVVEDLHWADPSSLELFTNVMFAIADTAMSEDVPLCLLGSFRPAAPQTPLARHLARWQREEICQVLELPGFTEDEIHALLAGLGIERAAQQLVQVLNAVAGGNPLFIRELLHYLRQRHALHERDGYTMTTVSPSDLRLPDQVTSVIRDHIDALSPGCRETLGLASLLGDEFSLRVLSAASHMAEDEVLAHLEEGLHQGILLSEGQSFQFSHALTQQVLYSLPSVVQRQRYHAQIAHAWEALDEVDAHDRILQIAHHWVRAGDAADADQMVHYARLAGDHAFAMADWHLAAHYYAAVLAAGEPGLASATPEELADLYYRAAVSHARDGNVSLSDAYYGQAIEAYSACGDVYGQARALIDKTLRMASASYGTLVDMQPFESLIEAVGEDDLSLRGRLATAMSELYWAGRQPEMAQVMAHNAVELGKASQDYVLCARASFNSALAYMQSLRVNEALEHYQQAQHYAEQGQDVWIRSMPIQRLGTALFIAGRFDEAEAVADEAYAVSQQTNNWRDYSLILAARTAIAAARGAVEAAERYAQETMLMVARYRFPFGGVSALSALAYTRAMRGDWAQAAENLDMLAEPGRVFEKPSAIQQTSVQLYRQLIQMYEWISSPDSVPSPAGTLPPVPEQCDMTTLPLYCVFVELAAAGMAVENVPQLYAALDPVGKRGVRFARGWGFLLPRILGVAAALQQQYDDAEAHFHTAMATALDVLARPELARTYLDYARMLLARNAAHDRKRALELLEKAAPILQEQGMIPFSQYATKLIETLASPPIQ